MGKNKGKKKQPKGDQPAASNEPEAGSSRGATGGQGDQPGPSGSSSQQGRRDEKGQGDGKGTQQEHGKGGKGGPPQPQPPTGQRGPDSQPARSAPQEHSPQEQAPGGRDPSQQFGGAPQRGATGRGRGRGDPQQQPGGYQQQAGGAPQRGGMGGGQGRGEQHQRGGGRGQGRGDQHQRGGMGRGQGRGEQPQQHGGYQQQAGVPPQMGTGRDPSQQFGGAPQQQGGFQSQPQSAPQWGAGRGGQQQRGGAQTQAGGRGPPQSGQDRGMPVSQQQQVSPQRQQAQDRSGGRTQPPSQSPAGPSSSRSPSESSVASISASFAKMPFRRSEAGDANIVSQYRRKPGTLGRIIKVESNHLDLNLGQLNTAYHYDVNIVPDVPKKFMRPVVESFRRQFFPKRWPAFDGRKNLYTSSPLTNNLNDIFDKEITISEEDGREKKFKVQIKFANSVDMTPLRNLLSSPVTPQEAIQVVDIVLRMAPIQTCFPVGRSFFVKPTNGIIDLGEGMEMYHGFYQSAIRGWKPLLNVDVAHKAFPQNIPVIDALAQLLTTYRQEFRREDLRSLNPMQEETLLKYIKSLRVTYEIYGQPGTRKNYRVNGLGGSAARTSFVNNGQTMTIQAYFERAKNCRLRFPDLPTLWVGNPQRPDKILLPLELCTIIEGQALNRKMTEQQTSKMIKHAATNTTIRKQKIMQGIQRANYSQSNCIKEFGFSVGSEFQKLNARVLPPPALQYGSTIARVQKGIWNNGTFLSPVCIKKWTIASVCRYPPRPDDYRNMCDMFERKARDVGMEFASRATDPFVNIGGRQAYRDVEEYFKSQKDKQYDVIFVIVPDSGPQYSFVKKAAEIAVGCLTQCIKSVTLGRKMNPQTALNILLKVNSKLNGINHTFSKETKPAILRRPVMIMGADVTHPGPDARDIPSVAAVTASHDPKAFQYNITWRLQNPKVEIIEDLEAIVIEHLKFFRAKTNVKPEAIVFFRDGVSEGQFEQVKNAEIRAIRSGCKKLQAEGFEPKITFLVVQKRHHTRLFPMNSRDSEDRNFNVPAGTCVDTDITHPFLQDFYLVSHASIQGVAKPTKYCTLWDENNMDNDQVEQLAYYLCHMFSRCNRSVSYPAPTYYAHLAAARAKVYIENDRLNMDRLREEFDKYEIRREIKEGRPMFFV